MSPHPLSRTLPRASAVRVRCLLLAALCALTLLAVPSGAQALEQKVVAADGAANDYLGQSVAVDGDTAVVGAPAEGGGRGAVYVFTRGGDSWVQAAKLTAADGAANDYLGYKVAIEGDTIVASAWAGDVAGNADQGAAYTFARTGGDRTQTAKLTASDGAAGDQLGVSVAIEGDTIVAGANADEVDSDTDQGSAYTFARGGADRTQTAKLTASDGSANDYLGWSVEIDGDTIVSGAPFDGGNQGSAYTFDRSGTDRTQTAKLTASDGAAGHQVGYSVAMDGDTIVAGSPSYDFGATKPGFVYTFARTGGDRTQTAELTASDGAGGDQLGWSVAIDGDTIVAGANADDVGANFNQGSAYTFARSGADRNQTARLTASDGEFGDLLGWSVAIDGETIVAGAIFDQVGANARQGSASIFFQPSTDLEIQKTDSPDPVSVGSEITYDLAVKNNGPSPATSVESTDDLPAGVSFESASAGCTEAAGTVTCDYADVASGDTETKQIVVTANQVGTTTNTATVDGAGPDPTAANDSSTATTQVEPSADLDIQKTDSPDPVSVGSDITYDLAVTNNGSSPATDVRASDDLPAGVSFKSAPADCGVPTGAAQTVLCDYGDVASGATESRQIVVTANEAGTVSNTATVDGAQGDPVAANDSSTATTQVNAVADLAIDKSAPARTVDEQLFDYTLAVSNTGPSTAAAATITDQLPAGIEYVSDSGDGACAEDAGTVTCELADLPGGQSSETTLRVRVKSPGEKVNTASVSSATPDPDSSDNDDSATTVVTAPPPASADLSLELAAADSVRQGQRFSYTARVRNAGPAPARSTLLRVRLSGGQRFLSASAGCTYARSNRTVTCSLGDLASGASRARGITVEATEPGSLSARGTVSSPTADSREANDSQIESVVVRPSAPRPPACTIIGTSSNDVIVGTRGDDVICAGAGNDIVRAGGGEDLVYGGEGRDVLRGDEGADRLFGQGGADVLTSSDGVRANDRSDGGGDSDLCQGDAGDTRSSC